MRKNRNTFFSEANMSYANYNPNMNMMSANAPFEASTAYNSFYAGPNPGVNQYTSSSDIDSRLAKIERQLNRLEHRISKLEAKDYTIDEIESNSTNMYML